MDRKSIVYRLLSFCFLFATYFLAAQSVQPLFTEHKAQTFLVEKFPEEGFCAGTLIKIPDGYELIENLMVGNVVIDAYGNPTEIVAITKRFVHE